MSSFSHASGCMIGNWQQKYQDRLATRGQKRNRHDSWEYVAVQELKRQGCVSTITAVRAMAEECGCPPQEAQPAKVVVPYKLRTAQNRAPDPKAVPQEELPLLEELPPLEEMVLPPPIERINRLLIVADSGRFKRHLDAPGNREECGQRLDVIERELKRAKIMREDNTIVPRKAIREEVLQCHTKEYLNELEEQTTALQDAKQKRSTPYQSPWKVEDVHGDVELSVDSYETAFLAAGAPLIAIEQIMHYPQNGFTRALCLSRPPGHHAHANIGSGFCLFNNAMIATLSLIKKFDFRVAIIDPDAHVGEGIQTLIEDTPGIQALYLSTHMDTADGTYPGERWGHANCQEDRAVEERNIFYYPIKGKTKEVCRNALMHVHAQVAPSIIRRFRPDFMILAMGFDAHKHDPIGGKLGLETEDFATLTRVYSELADELCGGRMVSILEGGYNLRYLPKAVLAHAKVLANM